MEKRGFRVILQCLLQVFGVRVLVCVFRVLALRFRASVAGYKHTAYGN